MDFTADYSLTIDGKPLTTGRTMEVFNPATGKALAQVPKPAAGA